MNIPFWQFGLITAILITLIFLSGCTEKPVSEPEIVSEYPAEIGEPFHPITMDEGIYLLNRFSSEDLGNPDTPLPIYYAHGKEVNQEGKGEQWIFGTKLKEDQFFVVVESNKQILIPYQMDIPKKAINIKGIILPDALIAKNTPVINAAFGKNGSIPLLQFDLIENTYAITLSRGNVPRILYFEASTGALINL